MGELEAWRGEQRLALPPSKKTRALLGYLVVTGRPHRRERLCSLLWDVTDDPRGALRWSLSKLRSVADDPDHTCIVADRESVRFECAGAWVDVLAIRDELAGGVDAASIEQLEECARHFRGELLEGLELPEFHDFRAWLIAEREAARSLHAKILASLVERLGAQPERALVHARALAQVDPLNESARATLIRLLAETGGRREAEQHFHAATRMFEELGSEATGELAAAWREVTRASRRAAGDSTAPVAGRAGGASTSPIDARGDDVSAAATQRRGSDAPAAAAERRDDDVPIEARALQHVPITALIGRDDERRRLASALDQAVGERRERVVLLTGEPGIGKTRLLTDLILEARSRGGTVLDGCAYEAESGRPYGPWIEALRRVPRTALGATISTDLAPLLPELSTDSTVEPTRERLFGAVVELVAARASSAPPVLLILDDAQWLDEASTSLLHYVARMSRHRPVVIALAVRDGELADNEPLARVLRGLRREHAIDEIAVQPLDPVATEALVRRVMPDVDAARVYQESAGNPLFALELARALPSYEEDAVPQTLTELVRDRVERLPGEAADVLRWAAVLGRNFTAGGLAELSTVDFEALVSALEALERHGLIRAVAAKGRGSTGDGYVFSHSLVQRAVYAELSAPRRRLMHLRVARAFEARLAKDETVAADLARHAALAGEAGMAAHACVAAGKRCLTLFANAEADALARRGMHYAEQLPDPERTTLTLELMQIRLGARRPEDADATARSLEELAEHALDLGSHEHARLGFHMSSYLHWEGGDWSDAQKQMMRAELVSRGGDEEQRAVATAEAARCLTMLERDLGHAEALAMEARSLARRTGVEPAAVADALGMLRLHRGELDEAAELFEQARVLARGHGDRLDEFYALEHRFMLEIQRERYGDALTLAGELQRIGAKLREGSEAAFAGALEALARFALGEAGAADDLRAGIDALEVVDAKHRLACVLASAAYVAAARGDHELAVGWGNEGLAVASKLGRASEIALARIALARAAVLSGQSDELEAELTAVSGVERATLSAHAREAVNRLLADYKPRTVRR